jgi:tRNA pseudouridine55 synthase
MMTTNEEKECNILLVDKPKGISSYGVIRILQKKMGKRKMGHAGTLDPLATGLLIIGIDKGTKMLSSLIGLPKVYEAEILLGKKTITADIEGEIIEEQQIPVLVEEKILDVIQSMVGTHELAVPIYSAVKRQGKPLYAYAREGKDVEVPVKQMTVTEANLLGFDEKTVRIRFNVSSGTYIRTLAEEFARRMGTVGTIQNLRRLSIGTYSVDKAMTIEM